MLHRVVLFLTVLAANARTQTIQGFNYGSVGQTTSTYTTLFNHAKQLSGTSGFNSARLFTMIQDGTVNSPIEAIPAAINTGTTLLLGLWASAGDTVFENEIAALKTAVLQYGPQLKAATVGISVGSEDLYRITPTGVVNHAGVGAGPDLLIDYVQRVRDAVAGTVLGDVPIGHVDTWTAWVNSSNSEVVDASDFIGMDAYPYYQYLQNNDISNSAQIFEDAYDATQSVAKGKPVWITETGWPTSGPTEGKAEANVQNAENYWKTVGCKIFGTTNVWWFDLQGSDFSVDASGDSKSPSYDLSCASSAVSSSETESKLPSAPASTSTKTSHETSSGAVPMESIISSSTPCGTCTDFVGIDIFTTLVTTYTTTYCPSSTSTFVQGNGETRNTVLPYATHITVATRSVVHYPHATLAKSVNPTHSPGPTTYFPYTSTVLPTGCGNSLTPTFEFPHLIIHLNSSQPNAQPGPSYYGWVYPDTSSGFNFDIPPSYSDKTCSLVFLLPELHDLETSTFAFEGRGGLQLTKLNAPIVDGSTFAAVAAAGESAYGAIEHIQPGNGYVVTTVPCRDYAGRRIAFRLYTDDNIELNWFEDYNAPALGLFMNIC